MRIEPKNIRNAAFFFIFSYAQAQYFSHTLGRASIMIGLLCFTLIVLSIRTLPKPSAPEISLTLIAVATACLYALLELFGQKTSFSTRLLFPYAAIQIILFLIAFSGSNTESQLKGLNRSLMVYLAVEFIIIIGQFLYLATGHGFAPQPGDDSTFYGITGSKGNPNDTAMIYSILTLYLSIYAINYSNRTQALLLTTSAIIVCALTLSRTVTVITTLNLFLITYYSIVRHPKTKPTKTYQTLWFASTASLFLVFAFWAHSMQYIEGSQVLQRSLQRIETMGSLADDSSVLFRLTVLQRLAESLPRLGIGTFSDLDYSLFFQPSDHSLMTTNPHSLIAEFSFLFGWPGLILISSYFLIISYLVAFKTTLSFISKTLIIFSFFLTQSVPSSLLDDHTFFLIFIMFWLAFRKKHLYSPPLTPLQTKGSNYQ